MRLPSLPHVKYVRAKGRVYAYFNTGQKVREKPVYTKLPAPSSVGFFDTYAALCAVRTKRQAAAWSVSALIDDYMASADFRDKSDATRRAYTIHLAKVRETLGEIPADDLQPADVTLVLDGEGWGAATRNGFVSVIGALYTWARKRGKSTLEPTKGMGRAKTGSHDPWPDDILEAALKSDDARVRLAVHLLYFTGQRIGDVCQIRWGDIRGDALHLTQQKTGKRLSIPLHSELVAELARTQRRALTILTSTTGCKPQVNKIREELQAFTIKLGVETVPHGLRKNAVNSLLEAGCAVAEVAAITGQTYAMVEHYAAKVDTRKLGQAAMLKFEKGRGTKVV